MSAAEEPGSPPGGAGLPLVLRTPVPKDYAHVAGALADWMPPERVERLLPRGSLTHFARTSQVAVDPADGSVAGFLIAFVPGEQPGVGYVHFVWVSPERRRGGLGRRLYLAVLDLLREQGCSMVEAVTARGNHAAIAFHERLGFTIQDSEDAAAAGSELVPAEGTVLMTLVL